MWAERVAKINQAWMKIERLAVFDGERAACLSFANPEQMPDAAASAVKGKLVLLPLTLAGMASQYSSTSQALVPGRPWHYRVVLIQPEFTEEWLEAWNDPAGTSNKTIGKLLGYPNCCRDFFERVWVEGKGVDTTWDMGLGSAAAEGPVVKIPAGSPPESNILLRWLGVRLVPHLPCSFHCMSTVYQGRTFAEVGRRHGFSQEVEWMYEMLDWPAEWSALHGIAEIRTPVNTVSTRTDATGKKLVVQREGTSYPDEGAQGLRFPFRVVTGKVTDKPSFKRSLLPIHELNGFGSEGGMNTAHETLLSVLPPETGAFLDLGCGNGRLLERAAALGWTVTGVESDNARAGAAKVPVRRGDLMDTPLWTEQFDVIAFMPGRLLEGGADEKKESVRQALRGRARYVLLYAYGDWLSKFGGLGPLVAEAGLGASEVVKFARADGVEAALVVFTQSEGQHEFQTATIGHGSEK